MKILRNILFSILGLKRYLQLVSRTYLFMVNNGLLKKKYPELFFLKKIIQPGFICIDIGANLAYYSSFLSRIVMPQGKVIAVEPVTLFAEIFEKNCKRQKLKNVELLNYALGGENKSVQMGLPEVNGTIHHGMTKITSIKNEKYIQYFEVEMRVPDDLFENLERLDFIKCDVEGYESEVFSNMKNTLIKHKPLVQSELSGKENRSKVVELFKQLGYKVCGLINGCLAELSITTENTYKNDFYFIPPEKEGLLK